MIIRPMTEEDIPFVAEIEKTCFTVFWSEEEIRKSFAYPHYRFLVAEDGGKIAGYAGVTLIAGEGDIANVAVLPEFRKQGIGEALMRGLIELSKKEDAEAMVLEVRASNVPAITLYEKLSFRPIGRRKGYYTKPEEDAILYGLNLTEG